MKSIFNCKFHWIGDKFHADVVTKRCSLLRKGEQLMYNKDIIIYFSDLFNLFRSKCTRIYSIVPENTRLYTKILYCTRIYHTYTRFGYFRVFSDGEKTNVLWYFCSTVPQMYYSTFCYGYLLLVHHKLSMKQYIYI